MNWKATEEITKNPDKQWFYNQTQIAKILGCDRGKAREFLISQSVPWRLIGREKSYFLPEVLEAVEKTKWLQPPTKKGFTA